MRSLYSGVSGLNNHQIWMDVISNNVSNVNTHGFKKNRLTFEDMIYQTISSASAPAIERGGINPKQVGLGVKVSSVDTVHTQGAMQTTGINTDLAIMGNGFFVERNDSQIIYSRSGAYSLDADGVLVNPANGNRVQGFLPGVDENGNRIIDYNGGLQDLIVPIGEKVEARATTLVNYRSNLNRLTNPNVDGAWTSSIQVINSLGEEQELQLSFTKSLDADGNEILNEWQATITVFTPDGTPIPEAAFNIGEEDSGNTFTIRFNNVGAIVNVVNSNNPDAVVGDNGAPILVNLTYPSEGAEPMNINLNLGTSGQYDGITQFASESSTKAYFQNGVGMGYLEGFTINNSGIIIGSYTNGLKQELGQLGMATFANTGGLEKIGDTYFDETFNSGIANIAVPNSQGFGSINAGMLEMSNVDLTSEFTDMIVAQRGFQANSRSITTSDTMLEEILRLKR